jgi:hypothetical protein
MYSDYCKVHALLRSIPTPDGEECMLLDDLSLGAVSSDQFATDITLRAKCKQPAICRRYRKPINHAT